MQRDHPENLEQLGARKKTNGGGGGWALEDEGRRGSHKCGRTLGLEETESRGGGGTLTFMCHQYNYEVATFTKRSENRF